MAPDRKLKKCPFCGEMILADALKCRYCKEFLEEDDQDLPVSHHAVNKNEEIPEGDFRSRKPFKKAIQEPDMLGPDNSMNFTPSMLGLAGSILSGIFFMSIAVVVMIAPFEKILEKLFSLNPEDTSVYLRYIRLAGLLLAIVVLMGLIFKAIKLKTTRYDVSADRIEWSRGIFNRRVDNIDMFRVVDLKMHRSLVDCLFGIGSVIIMTRDETDPVFVFEKIRNPKRLYDIIKVESLKSDRRQGVVHFE